MGQKLAVQNPPQDFLYDALLTFPLDTCDHRITLHQGPAQPIDSKHVPTYVRDCHSLGIIPFSHAHFKYTLGEKLYLLENGIQIHPYTPSSQHIHSTPVFSGGKPSEVSIEFTNRSYQPSLEPRHLLTALLKDAQRTGYDIEQATLTFPVPSGLNQLFIQIYKTPQDDGITLSALHPNLSLDQRLIDWFLDLKKKHTL